jgi:methionyl-tRNA formyltransferase
LQVQCGSGLLAVSRLQPAGRRIMSASEFAAGTALEGARLD